MHIPSPHHQPLSSIIPERHLQLRSTDYTGARHALAHGVPPPESKGGRCQAQHLWLSLAKLADLSGASNEQEDTAAADPAVDSDIDRRLELAEVREELLKLSNAVRCWYRVHLCVGGRVSAFDRGLAGDEGWMN